MTETNEPTGLTNMGGDTQPDPVVEDTISPPSDPINPEPETVDHDGLDELGDKVLSSIRTTLEDMMERTRGNAKAASATLDHFMIEIEPKIKAQLAAAATGDPVAQSNLRHLAGQAAAEAAIVGLAVIQNENDIIRSTVFTALQVAVSLL